MNPLKNKRIILLLFLIIFTSCYESSNTKDPKTNSTELNYDTDTSERKRNYISGFDPLNEDGTVNMLIEIPAGTNEKWEVNKSTETLEPEIINNKPRIVSYLPYPANYGMIPGTLLSKEKGGDGDPLDIILLGPTLKRGSIVTCELIGIMNMIDTGEKDDKLIGVTSGNSFHRISSIAELDTMFPGITGILKIWFENYKSPSVVTVTGFSDKEAAYTVLKQSITEYNN